MTQYKNQFASILVEYIKQAKGPFKAEAIAEVFQSKVLEDMSNLFKDIE